MMSSRPPIIDQLHHCATDQERARILLSVPDVVLLQYADVFRRACRRVLFDAGEQFIDYRLHLMRAVRDEAGLLPERLSRDLETMRQAMARFAAQPEISGPVE